MRSKQLYIRVYLALMRNKNLHAFSCIRPPIFRMIIRMRKVRGNSKCKQTISKDLCLRVLINFHFCKPARQRPPQNCKVCVRICALWLGRRGWEKGRREGVRWVIGQIANLIFWVDLRFGWV